MVWWVTSKFIHFSHAHLSYKQCLYSLLIPVSSICLIVLHNYAPLLGLKGMYPCWTFFFQGLQQMKGDVPSLRLLFLRGTSGSRERGNLHDEVKFDLNQLAAGEAKPGNPTGGPPVLVVNSRPP